MYARSTKQNSPRSRRLPGKMKRTCPDDTSLGLSGEDPAEFGPDAIANNKCS